MFDGFKAKCNVSPETWLNCDQLDFRGEHNVKTGEFLRTPLKAEFQSLKFTLTPSTINRNLTHSNLRGSLHRFFYGGGNNAGKYTFENVCQTIECLHQNFEIVPEETTLENIEFGVNIETDRPAQWYIKNLIAHKNLRFVELVLEKAKVGKQCIRQQYKIKIYDKAKQAKQPEKNVLRIELSVNKMSVLKPFGIGRLSDLRNRSKIEPLGAFLAEIVETIVMFDKDEMNRKMSDKDRIKYLEYQNPCFWENIGHKKRSEHLKAYKLLCEKHGIEQPATELSQAVLSEWNILLNTGAFYPTYENKCTKNGGRFNQLTQDNSDSIQGAFYPLEYTANSPRFRLNHSLLKQIIKSVNSEKSKSHFKNTFYFPKPPRLFKPKKCLSCGSDIFYQRPLSRFCSAKYVGEKQAKRCRNKARGKQKQAKK